MTSAPDPRSPGDIVHPSALPFILVHLGCAAVIWTGVSLSAVVLGLALYWVRMFAITAGYHRLFSHRAYVTGRVFQFLLAFLAQTSGQKSVLWWAAKHRAHHLHSDTSEDPHSPRHGVLHSHIGWVFDRRHDRTDLVKVADLARFPELRWLHKYEALPPILLAGLCFLLAGWPGLVIGFCWSTTLVYHATFSINSLAHLRGRARYLTGDDSRNNAVLAVITMGEGWHNNHHAYQSSARQGFRWWEFDATYALLRLLSALRLVSDLKSPPEAVVRNQRPPSARAINRAARYLTEQFKPAEVAAKIRATLSPIELSRAVAALMHAPGQASELLAGWRLPHVPARVDFVRAARRLAASTVAVEHVVDRARTLFLTAVGAYLLEAERSKSLAIRQTPRP
jgi:stearoyl-CoA desaturase (delta-9 desaturase)